jgi:hypothetical protein
MDTNSYLEKCYNRDASVVFRKIAEELILVPIKQKAGEIESIYTMNEVAARIWELLDGTKNLGAIRDSIVNEFDVSREEAETDLREFLQQLEQIGAVRVT